jgi:hypothetical protein
MSDCTRFAVSLTVGAALLATGCDKAQSLLDDAKKQADAAMATKSATDPAESSASIPGDAPSSATPPVPTSVPTPEPVLDDAAIVAKWNATKTNDRNDNSIAELLKASPDSLKEITTFDFRSAGPTLTAAGLKTLKQFPLVKVIDCSLHTMSEEQVAAISELPELEDLGMLSCGLKDPMLASLKKLATLRTLNVSSNVDLTDAGMNSIHNLVEVQSLDFENTHIAGAFLLKAKFLGGLKRLHADASTFADGFPALKSTPNLEYLALSDVNVWDQQMNFLKSHTKLREVYFRKNLNISDVGFTCLDGNKNLEVVDIRGTNISGAGLKFLRNTRTLKLLKTQDARVDNLTLIALKKALPNCEFEPPPR